VRLVDHQVGLSRLADHEGTDAPQGGARGEDVVVVADDDIGFGNGFDLELEGADLVQFAEISESAGPQLLFFRHDLDQAGARHLRVVVAGILALFRVAKRLVLGADLVLGGEGEGFNPGTGLPETLDGVLGHRVLAIFGRQVHHLLPPAQGLPQHRVQHPDRLSKPGGSLDQ